MVIHVSPADSSQGNDPTLLCYTRENSGHLSPATFAETDVKDVMNKNLVMLQLKASLQLHLSMEEIAGLLAIGNAFCDFVNDLHLVYSWKTKFSSQLITLESTDD